MMKEIVAEPLTAKAFKPFGDVVEAAGAPDRMINEGLCARHDDLARLDFGPEGRAGVSIFKSRLRKLPYRLEMLERHPDGSQAFLPLGEDPFLVIVAPDEDGCPGAPRAFITDAGQGVNYKRGAWHGVLAPLGGSGLFAVIDRIGPGANLEEHRFASPYMVCKR